jgi:hypothetical protein
MRKARRYLQYYLVLDHHGKYVREYTADALPGATWPPRGGLKLTGHLDEALWFWTKKDALKVCRMLQCGCEQRAGVKSTVIKYVRGSKK